MAKISVSSCFFYNCKVGHDRSPSSSSGSGISILYSISAPQLVQWHMWTRPLPSYPKSSNVKSESHITPRSPQWKHSYIRSLLLRFTIGKISFTIGFYYYNCTIHNCRNVSEILKFYFYFLNFDFKNEISKTEISCGSAARRATAGGCGRPLSPLPSPLSPAGGGACEKFIKLRAIE